jgi:hypothetical protein
MVDQNLASDGIRRPLVEHGLAGIEVLLKINRPGCSKNKSKPAALFYAT